jgi:predicted DCC family thiol-disulfide oxidoreductase YuxK
MVEVNSKTRVGSHIVLYDGICGLCNSFIKFVVRHDQNQKFLFASLQSDFAYRALSKHNRNPKDLNTIFVIVDYGLKTERLLVRSKGAIYVLSELGNAWRLCALFNLLPDSLLDAAYNLIAKYRYRWFGKYDSCQMPDSETSTRFIEV